MPAWMVITDLPLKAATSTTPAARYLDSSAITSLLDQFENWAGNVNGGGNSLSNVGAVTATSLTLSGAITGATAITASGALSASTLTLSSGGSALGSFGVGVASPASQLHVISATEDQIRFSTETTNYGYLGRRPSDGYIILNANQAAPFAGFVLALASLERLTITPSRFWLRPGTLSAYANNAAAVSGGLSAGDFYVVSGTDPRQIAQVF